MKHTVKLLLETVYNEFSTRMVGRFTIAELARLAEVNRGTIYNNIGTIEQVYQLVFEEFILKPVTQGCDTFEDAINRFIDYVIENRTFCMNMYFCTAFMLRHQDALNLLEKLLLRYHSKKNSNDRGELISAYVKIIEGWFVAELSESGENIKRQLAYYHKDIAE